MGSLEARSCQEVSLHGSNFRSAIEILHIPIRITETGLRSERPVQRRIPQGLDGMLISGRDLCSCSAHSDTPFLKQLGR